MSRKVTVKEQALNSLHELDQLVRDCSDRLSELQEGDPAVLDLHLALAQACRSIRAELK